ncbi:von Willebrand factor [Cinnamomum micranthum f. kanehirae]|uniref:von Willebrand factor n=1 Tax=Cinnamomum micranthum f. kanehirae TaxID=337451 RepID=A0A443PYM6_9MAGN|nr:von Willebrand factor [Cinnamomum micranthum f. kanehirae]
MEDEFTNSVESGLKLAKRIYNGKDRFVSPPRPVVGMDKDAASRTTYLPTAPMVYAVIGDPAIVDNPDVPSYQPHVHGRCDPPALIPLQMNEIAMEVECDLDTAFVSVRGSWRVHCVMGSKSCDCRLMVPMGEQGSILGVEIEVARRLCSTQLMQMEETQDMEKATKGENGGFLKPQMFSLTVPKVDGGSNLSIKVSWLQQLLYTNGQFSLNVPFDFPEYITPPGKRFPTKEKIQLNVNSGLAMEVTCDTASHPLKEKRRQMGKMGFLYEADVLKWSTTDFRFSYTVSANDIFGCLLLQSPSVHDFDQREIFCMYLFPGQIKQVFRKEVVFLVDISGSMQGKPLENARNAIATALSKLSPKDSFSIIAFNEETSAFSSSMEFATEEVIERATQWMSERCVAGGGTNILAPLNEAMEILANACNSTTHIFLVTDGSVEDERNICNVVRTHMKNIGSTCPRISTFGIGSYCNHYFLRMLALIGRGYYDAAYDADSIETRLQRLFTIASSSILANITVESFDDLDDFEVYPFPLPDLSSECPLILSGRYRGNFPDTVKVKGILADMRGTAIDMKVQKAKDISLDKVFVRRWIDVLTSQAWFSESKQLEEKIVKMSLQAGVTSEYTHMVLLQNDNQKPVFETEAKRKSSENIQSNVRRIALLRGLGIGFGNVTATMENAPVGFGNENLAETNEVYVKAKRCCSKLGYCCCCPCCISACSRINDQCMVALAQLCAALSCLGCAGCIDLCCNDSD